MLRLLGDGRLVAALAGGLYPQEGEHDVQAPAPVLGHRVQSERAASAR